MTDIARAVADVGALIDVPGRPLNRTDGLAGIFVLLGDQSNTCFAQDVLTSMLAQVEHCCSRLQYCFRCSAVVLGPLCPHQRMHLDCLGVV